MLCELLLLLLLWQRIYTVGKAMNIILKYYEQMSEYVCLLISVCMCSCVCVCLCCWESVSLCSSSAVVWVANATYINHDVYPAGYHSDFDESFETKSIRWCAIVTHLHTHIQSLTFKWMICLYFNDDGTYVYTRTIPLCLYQPCTVYIHLISIDQMFSIAITWIQPNHFGVCKNAR